MQSVTAAKVRDICRRIALRRLLKKTPIGKRGMQSKKRNDAISVVELGIGECIMLIKNNLMIDPV